MDYFVNRAYAGLDNDESILDTRADKDHGPYSSTTFEIQTTTESRLLQCMYYVCMLSLCINDAVGSIEAEVPIKLSEFPTPPYLRLTDLHTTPTKG